MFSRILWIPANPQTETYSSNSSNLIRRPKADFSSTLEANISGNVSSTRKASPVQIKEARIISHPTPKSSPARKPFVPPTEPIVPLNPFEDDYDEEKNPFAQEDEDAVDGGAKDSPDDDYDKNLNPFAS